MKNIQYVDILKRAFLMVWENKFLWFFGLLVFLGSFPPSFNFSSDDGTKQSIQFQSILGYMQEHPKFFLAIILIAFIFIVVFFLLRIIGITAIIKSVSNITVYKQSKILAIFSEAKQYFWQLVLLEIIIVIALTIVVVVLFIPVAYLLALNAKMFVAISTIVAVLIIIVLVIIANYLRRYSYFYIVLGNMKIKMALEAAHILFMKNIWESLIMGCVEIALNIMATVLISAVLLTLLLVCSPLGFIAHLIFAQADVTTGLTMAGIVISCAVLLILFSLFTAFAQSAWVLFFQEISLEKKEEKKIFEKVEVAEKIPDPEII